MELKRGDIRVIKHQLNVARVNVDVRDAAVAEGVDLYDELALLRFVKTNFMVSPATIVQSIVLRND